MIWIVSRVLFYLQFILTFIIFRRNSPIRVHQRKENFGKTQRILSKLRYTALLASILLDIYLKDYSTALINSTLLLVAAVYDVRSPYWRK